MAKYKNKSQICRTQKHSLRLPPIHWKDQVKVGSPQIKQVGMGPFRFRPYPSIRGNFRSPGRVKADILATRRRGSNLTLLQILWGGKYVTGALTERHALISALSTQEGMFHSTIAIFPLLLRRRQKSSQK